MTGTIIWTIVILAGLGLLLALILFWVAKKFKVEEDPRIDEVEKVMPGQLRRLRLCRMPCLCRCGSESSEPGRPLLSCGR